jgi:hypothetical protein
LRLGSSHIFLCLFPTIKYWAIPTGSKREKLLRNRIKKIHTKKTHFLFFFNFSCGLKKEPTYHKAILTKSKEYVIVLEREEMINLVQRTSW